MEFIFDSHVHVFHPKVISERENFFDDQSFRLLYSCSKSRLVDETGLDKYFKDFDVKKAAVMGFPWTSNQYCEMQNEYFAHLSDFSDFSERLTCFGSIPLSADSSTIKSFALNIKKLGLAGIGEIGFYCNGMDSNSQKWLVSVLEEASKNDLKICLHVNEPVGHHYTGKYDPKLFELLQIIAKFTDLKIILAHLGGGLIFYELMPEVKDILKNCVYDTAAIPFLYSDDIYKIAVNLAGEERILFGSDFPLLNVNRYKSLVQLCGKEISSKIMSENFQNFFDLQ
jgi:predicted TIM-barrel fold metal-dependent hydrolase